VVPLEAFVELTIELAMPVIGDSALRIPGSTSVRGAEHRVPLRAFLGLFGVLEESELSHLPDVIVPVCQEESSAGSFPPPLAGRCSAWRPCRRYGDEPPVLRLSRDVLLNARSALATPVSVSVLVTSRASGMIHELFL
jgi:hypothetical protein